MKKKEKKKRMSTPFKKTPLYAGLDSKQKTFTNYQATLPAI